MQILCFCQVVYSSYLPLYATLILEVYMKPFSSGNPTHLHIITDDSFLHEAFLFCIVCVLLFLNCFVLFLPLSNCKLREEWKLKYPSISRTPSTGFIRPSETELIGFMVKITDL